MHYADLTLYFGLCPELYVREDNFDATSRSGYSFQRYLDGIKNVPYR